MKLQLFALLLVALAANGAHLKWNPRYSFNERIVGGKVIDVKYRPFQVSLQNWGHFCGGSVISENYVLTAAHCAVGQNPNNLNVRVGSSFHAKEGELVPVEKLTVHPKYNGATIDYDFALVKLSQNLTFSETVQPVKLAEQDQETDAETLCTVSGWGSTQNVQESNAQLRAVVVPVVDQDKCNEAYQEYSGVTPRMVCAGFEKGGKDSCQGDSGGPMTADGVLVGVVSWGKGCALKNYPGVYARVASVRNWVRENSGV